MAKAELKLLRLFLLELLALIVAWRFPLCVHVWRQIGDLHMNCLILFELWWDRANAIRNFVTRLWDVFAFDAEEKRKCFT